MIYVLVPAKNVEYFDDRRKMIYDLVTKREKRWAETTNILTMNEEFYVRAYNVLRRIRLRIHVLRIKRRIVSTFYAKNVEVFDV